MNKKEYYLGIDAGGTKTAAVLCDVNGETLRTCQMGPGNIAVLDRGTIAQLLRNISSELLAGESIKSIKWACFAFAGAGRAEEKNTANELITALGFQNFTVMTDAEIRYYSIFGEETGILVSAGTGSICLVKTPDQQLKQIGGWGYLLSDEGSGFDIGRRAIKTVLRDLSHYESLSAFSQKILSFYGLEKPENLISIIYSSINPPRLIASCARFVCELADHKDPEALRIVDEATTALVEFALQAVKLIEGDQHFTYKVALAGGIFRNNSIIFRTFVKKIEQMKFKFEYRKPELDPAAAAALYALRQDQQSVTQNLIDHLYQINF
ncbi:MAG: hypothetical protein JSW33_13620 [bacterium]|nr:MAG: hypothetical protein JSW33_13620 [bacterium]